MTDTHAELALLLKAHEASMAVQPEDDDTFVEYDSHAMVTVTGYDRIIKLLQAQVDQVIADHKEEAEALNKCIDGLRAKLVTGVTPRGDAHMEKLLQDTEEAAERVMNDHDETFKKLADRAVELSPGHEKIAKAMAAPIRERLGLPPLPEEDDDDEDDDEEDYDGPRQPGTPAKLGTLFKKDLIAAAAEGDPGEQGEVEGEAPQDYYGRCHKKED